MANRYWVGGAGTWNTSSTTNWSASSGGASGASVPTAADSVFFDQAGTYTVTLTGALTCLDFTVSAGTVTFSSTGTLAISGSMSLLAGTVWSATGNITFNSPSGTKTITTNGTAFAGSFGANSLAFTSSGGFYNLGSAITLNIGNITITAGTLQTMGYAVTLNSGAIISTSGTRTLNLQTSTVTLNNSGTTALNLSSAGLSFSAGTSQINLTASSTTISAANLTLYNVAFTNTGASSIFTITGSSTFNNLSFAAPAVIGNSYALISANQTINGALTTTGTAGNRRLWISSETYGIGRTLTINSAASLTDADFRDIYVIGTAAPISGTRVGNRGNNSGITFSAPKTVYWNLAGAQNWSANGWCAASGGTPSTDYFPLPQDTAVFNNTGSVTGTITLDSALLYIGSIDMSARTTAMTLSIFSGATVYGNWTNGSGTTLSGASTLTFSGESTKTITSASKTFPCPINVDAYGGTVQLADAFALSGTNALTVTNGTFDSKSYNLNFYTLASNNTNVRAINFGASTVTLSSSTPFTFSAQNTGLTLNAGTSTLNLTNSSVSFTPSGYTWYNLQCNAFPGATASFTNSNTFNKIKANAFGTGLYQLVFTANNTITSLDVSGGSSTGRTFLRSNTIGTQRTLTVGSYVSASDIDFRDINIAGAASSTSITRGGDCGGNSGITFPVAKTVYWNLAGSQNWSATAWCTASGGTPDINQFPLAQDTAVFDNTGTADTVTIDLNWNIGTFNASARTSAMTFSTTTLQPLVYGNWLFGTGVISASTTGAITFAKNGTQTITSNGVQFGCPVTINNPSAIFQLADALSLSATRALTLTTGTFDAVSYNVTIGGFAGAASTTLKMGSGTWTLSGTGVVWNQSGSATQFAGTSNIVLSDTSTGARTFAGGSLYYNKLTIGGTTGTSTLTISGNNTFGELASTKTVAHTIDFGTTVQTFGKWSVTGTVGNVVTITGTSASNNIYGPAVTGVDYLAMGSWGISTTSPAEFYAGANSTGTATAPVYRTVAPSSRTLYWVGGTGNWSATTSWSTSSGGASGAAIPTSLDSVTFNSASNATAYTATIDAGVAIARCAAFTMAGPASGNVTFAGTVSIAYHGNVSFAATGITRTYTGGINLSGNSSYTFTTNGLQLLSGLNVAGFNSSWSLGSSLDIQYQNISFILGSFNTAGYAVLAYTLGASATNVCSLSLGASTVSSATNLPVSFGTTTVGYVNFTFNAGTSTISNSCIPQILFYGGGKTFYNVSLAARSGTAFYLSSTFNNLTLGIGDTLGIFQHIFSANQTINGTLDCSTASNIYRSMLVSDTLGTPRTLTVGTLTATDADFRDITIAGAASGTSPARAGNCGGNSGITFPAARTVYYRQTGSNSWGVASPGSWSLTSGGALDATAFPLAQDTAVFPAATYPASGSTTTINASWNIGTIDMSLRTTNTMTLATTTPIIYGNWINGTGITLSGTGAITFSGRGSQTITSAGRTFTQDMIFYNPGASITLLDSFISDRFSGTAIQQNAGTFNANGYNVTLSNGGYYSNTSLTRTTAIGTGTWLLGGNSSAWTTITTTGLTVTGTGTISLTNASAKTFAGGGANYSGITLNQGGAGTLSIAGNNTFGAISQTYVGATTISLTNTIQTVGAWTAKGTAGNLLTITGTSAAAPAALVYTGSVPIPNLNYLVPTFVKANPATTTWYAGANSTNGGSLGWIFSSYSSSTATGNFFLMF